MAKQMPVSLMLSVYLTFVCVCQIFVSGVLVEIVDMSRLAFSFWSLYVGWKAIVCFAVTINQTEMIYILGLKSAVIETSDSHSFWSLYVGWKAIVCFAVTINQTEMIYILGLKSAVITTSNYRIYATVQYQDMLKVFRELESESVSRIVFNSQWRSFHHMSLNLCFRYREFVWHPKTQILSRKIYEWFGKLFATVFALSNWYYTISCFWLIRMWLRVQLSCFYRIWDEILLYLIVSRSEILFRLDQYDCEFSWAVFIEFGMKYCSILVSGSEISFS